MRAITIVLSVMVWLALPDHAGAAGLTAGTSRRASVEQSAPAGPARHLTATRTGWRGQRSRRAQHLTAAHSGWRQTACLDCHDAAAMAGHKKPGLTPADCGPCHGYNGAPHESHAIPINPCGNCHARVAHVSAFAAPDDCIKCHVHPKSPQGR